VRISGEQFRREADEGRHHRQSLIGWWDQERVAQARILVVGAGALGNEVLKNLALLGARRLLIFDLDRIETSNLNRSVLFRTSDEGAPKATVAARALKDLDPECVAVGRDANLLHAAGLGLFHWADLVIGCVDNREARIFVNAACAATGRAWVDGAIESFQGIVRVFDPAHGPCYECTMNETDRKLVAERRSCAMLAREVAALGHVPATVTSAAQIGALQTQEAIKLLHGQPALVGEGLHTDGMWNEASRVAYPRREDCPGHENLGPITPLGIGTSGATLGELLSRAEAELGAGAVLDFSRDLVIALRCPECGDEQPGGAVLGALTEREAACPACGTHRIVDVAASASRGGPVDLALTPAALGLPPFDIVVARRGLEQRRAWLFDGDAESALGPLADSFVREVD
jgi:adenylyltransferase/sulfurtransferase